MNTLAEEIVTGMSAGSIYALLALGLALIYQVSTIVNFAQGALATVGAYCLWSLMSSAGLPFWPALLISLSAIFVLGAVVQTGLRRVPATASVVVTLGLLIVIEGVIGGIWSYSSKVLFLPISPDPLEFGPLSLSRLDVITIAVACVLAGLFFAFLRWTQMGTALRAVSQSPQGARLVGMRVERVRLMAWGMSAMLAAGAGVLDRRGHADGAGNGRHLSAQRLCRGSHRRAG